MSHTWNHFLPFANDTWRVMGFLALGLEGKAAVAVSASKHGLALKIAGKTVARGKDARTLCSEFDRYMDNQRAVIDSLKAELARVEAKARETT